MLLTLIHHRLPNREMLVKLAAGWHAHVGVMVAKIAGEAPAPFWESWLELRLRRLFRTGNRGRV